jgi:hypothetical protein
LSTNSNKVSSIPPPGSASNFFLVSWTKVSNSFVVHPSGTRPSTPFIRNVMALSKPNAWRTSSFKWWVNANFVPSEMWSDSEGKVLM